MGIPMGIGRLGQPNIIIKRKFRWKLFIQTPLGSIPEWYVKTAARPNLEIDELELNFLNAVAWMAGKGKWQPITVTYIDTTDIVMKPLLDWIASVYDLATPNALWQSEPSGYMGTATLNLYDGCGNALERWILYGVWPHSVNFGDLSYSESEEVNIELSLRYNLVEHQGLCGPSSTKNCTGCA
jgi:hypothetical protein